MTANIGIMQITSQFGPFDDLKRPQNTSRTKHDVISSKLIGKQYGVNLYMVTPGGKYPNFDLK